MAIYFNLHRFGPDEFAVGHLINGDLPADDEERWNILSAPRYRIQKLLAEHQSAQAQLRECRDSGKPFVLFLRSFSSEQRSFRKDGAVSEQFIAYSSQFMNSLALQLAQEGIQVIRLHGGSDALFPDEVGVGNILSTNAENWEAVAKELIVAASAIVLFIGELSPGVARELQLIRHHARVDETLVRIVDVGETPSPENSDPEGLRESLADFREMDWQALADVLRDARTHASLERAIDAESSYLEPDFVESEDFVATERHIWTTMINLRVLLEDTYWAALKRHGAAFEHLDFSRAWVPAGLRRVP